MIRIRPKHHAVLCYAEWCCDNNRPWPKLRVVAADMAWDQKAINRAFEDLLAWGLVSIRHCGRGHFTILRLGDGRETSGLTHDIHVIHRGAVSANRDIVQTEDMRMAA